MKKMLAAILMCAMLLSCIGSALAVTEDGVAYFGYEGMYAGEAFAPVTEGEPVVVKIIHQSDPNLTYFGDDTEDNNWYTKAMEKQLNIDIVYEQMIPASNYYDTLSLLFAGQDYPDAMKVNGQMLKELAEADLLRDMTEVYQTYASDYLKDIYGYTGVIFDGCIFDGKLLALPRQESGNSGSAMVYIRQDWLEAVGLTAPTTLEDLVNIARAFKNNDPDGNGQDDTWGIGVQSVFYREENGAGATSASLESVFHAMDAFPTTFYWNDDKTELIYGGISEEAKKALAYIAELVKEGLVEREFATMSWNEVDEAVYANKCGIVIAPWWQCVGYDMCTEGVLWLCYAAPLNGEGKYVNPLVNPAGEYVVVMKDASDEVAEAVMKIVNLQAAIGYTAAQDIIGEVKELYNDPGIFPSNAMFPFVCNFDSYDKHSSFSGQLEKYYGGEVTYDELPGEIKDLVPKFDMLNNDTYQGDFKAYFTSDEFIPWVSNYLVFGDSCLNLYKADQAGISSNLAPATFDINASDSWVEYGASLKKLQSEYYTKIALGERDIDAFDEFADLWLSLGGADVLDELKEVANR